MTLRLSSGQSPTDDVTVGRIAGRFGVRGELKCDPTSAGRIVFSAGAELRCVRPDGVLTIRLKTVRPHKGRLLIRIEDVDDATAAGAYAGALLCASRRRITLREGEYLDEDLVGCNVVGVDGTSYGSVERVEHYPASDMLVVGGKMVPMVRTIVNEIELESSRIVIDPPNGLMD
jgi:16S rRNA processing protein RimM